MIKFSCEKVFLQNAIAVTSRAVAQKSSIPALEGLLIHADQQLTISGYNMQTGIRTNVFANVVEGGDIVLNARLFGDIIRRMPDDVVVFTADDKQLVHLSCGDADFDILGLSAADYPELPMVEDDFSVSITSQGLFWVSLGMTGYAVQNILSRAYFARQKGKVPLAAGAASILVNVLLCMALAQRMGVAGLALSSAVSSTVYALLLDIPLELRGEGVLSRSFLLDLGKMALATALMAVGAWAVAGLTEGLLPGKAGELLTLGASAAAGVAVYFPAAVLLRLEEGQLALKMVKRVWKRG